MLRSEFDRSGSDGSAGACVPQARPQEAGVIRRVGILADASGEGYPRLLSSIAKFREGMAKFDWIEGRNLRIDLRFSGVSTGRNRTCAAELVHLAPDAIVAETVTAKKAVQLETSSI